MNKALEVPSKSKPGEGINWLEWAKFINDNKDKFSGRTKTGDKGITPEEVKAILAKYKEYVGAKAPRVTTLEEKLKEKNFDPEVRKSWNSLADWERDLWTEYQQKYGGSTESGRTDMSITPNDKFWMALRMSPQYMEEGFRETARVMFNDPLFIGSTLAGIALYLILWIAPEPFFSKAAAVMTTIALASMVAFTASELITLASAWIDLRDDTRSATTIKQLETAAERFGKRIGGIQLRILVALATIVGGKALPTPKPMPPTGGGGMVLAPAGGPPVGPQMIPAGTLGAVKIVNGQVVVVPTAPGLAMVATGGGGGGSGSGSGSGAVSGSGAGSGGPTTTTTEPPYVNNNPKAAPDEIAIGKLLNKEAHGGRLPGVNAVEGAPEAPAGTKTRSGDYRFTKPDGSKSAADLYQPESGNARSIETAIFKKSGQAETAVIELGRGNSGTLTQADAETIAANVIRTPGHSITRVIVIKDGKIIFDFP
jgi:hypothetical protein